jgi:tetratricopeptide (TPR) repeat protein
MIRRVSLTLLALAFGVSLAAAQTDLDLLPRRPEVVAREHKDGSIRFTVRGRDCAVADFLAALAERGRDLVDARNAIAAASGTQVVGLDGEVKQQSFSIVADPVADRAIRATLATVELYDRRAEQIVELLAAVSGVDFDVDSDSNRFRLVGPTARDSRPLLRTAVEQFYKMALARQGDDETRARSLRGLADVLRDAGDAAGSYAAYEQLLAEHSTSTHATDAELLLADCYMELDQNERANRLLRSFLAKCADPQRAELALRRLLDLLLEQKRFPEIVTLHEAFERIGLLAPETLASLADAGAVMLEESDADVVTFLLGSFRARPNEHAMLGPILGLAFSKRGDDESSRIVLEHTAKSIKSALDSTAALLAYSEISQRGGRYSAALVFAQRAVLAAEDNPVLRRRAHLLLADVYEALGVASRVYHHLWEAEQLSDSADAGRLALRAAEYALLRGETEHARLLFQSAIHYDGVLIDAQLGVARALRAAGDDVRALEHLRAMLVAEQGGDDRARIELALAESLAASGEFDRALAIVEGKPDPVVATSPEEKP